MDYSSYGIENAIVLDNTGVWRDREGLGRHLQAPGVAKVVLTAPGKGDVPNIVYGINNDCIVEEERIPLRRQLYHQCHHAGAQGRA